MYVIVGHPNSRAARLAWALEEMGLDWRYELASPQSEVALKYNPGGKVPILVDGDLVVPDSVAALTYLADKHGQLTHPAGTGLRALQDSFMQFACDEIDGSLWAAAKHRFALPEGYRIAEMKETARFEWTRANKTLEARLGAQSFVTGETFTIADIVIGHCAGWAMSAKFDWREGAVTDYFKRLQGREALASARAKGKALLD